MNKFFYLLIINCIILISTGCNKKENNLFTGYPDKYDNYYKPFKSDLGEFQIKMKSKKVRYGDIWIKDVAPVVTNKLIKFKYSPNYLSKKQSAKIDKSFRKWLNENNFKYSVSDIVLDGGNFIYNGFDTAIITNKIFKDNKIYSKKEIVNKLKNILEIENIVFINEEPGDVLGHADGQVHFIQKNILLIGDFLGKDKVKQQILEKLPAIKLVDLPSNYQEENQYDYDFPSAKGLYINMMETSTDIYIPKYNLDTDEKVVEIVKKYTTKKINKIDLEKLSTLGGSINCLTWYCPNEFLP